MYTLHILIITSQKNGHIDGINTLLNNGGTILIPENSEFNKHYKNGKSTIIEAVISHHSPLLNTKIKESNFRQTYNAVIISISKLGEILRIFIF